MDVSQASELYEAVGKVAKEDDIFRDELASLFEGMKGTPLNRDDCENNPNCGAIVEMLKGDDRIPFDGIREPEALVTIPIIITISIALCPTPAH